jgi:ankyrin repeat protein
MKITHLYSFWLFALLLCAVHPLTAQSFDSLKKKTTANYNITIADLLEKNDVQGMNDYLRMNPSNVNDASSVLEKKGLSGKIKKPVPLIHDAINRTLDGRCNVNMCKTIIDAYCDLNMAFEGKTPIYLTLDFIATHPKQDCINAEQILLLILNRPDFDVNQRYQSFLPPFAYLIRENHTFLGRFSPDYISDDILKLFIKKGAPVNTYDDEGNSLMNFAIETDNKFLASYFIENGIDLDRKNKEGNDALYLAIESGQLATIKSILTSTNFNLNINTLKNSPSTFKKYTDVYDYISDVCAKKAIIYKDIRTFTENFDDKFDLIRSKLDVIYNSRVNELEIAKTQATQIISNQGDYAGKESITQANDVFISDFATYYDPKGKKKLSDLVTQMLTIIEGLYFLEPLVNNPPGSYYTFEKHMQWEHNLSKFLSFGVRGDWFSYNCVEAFPGWGKIIAGTNDILAVVESYPEYAEVFNQTKEYMTKHHAETAAAMAKELVHCRAEATAQTEASEASYFNRIKRRQMKKCMACEIDEDKVKFAWNEQAKTFFFEMEYTRHNPGQIIMKNGDKYEFYKKEGGGWYIESGLFFSKEEFDKFEDLLLYFIEKCKETYCK